MRRLRRELHLVGAASQMLFHRARLTEVIVSAGSAFVVSGTLGAIVALAGHALGRR